MAGEAEMRRTVAPDGDHILGRAVGRLAHHPAMDREAERREGTFEDVEDFASCGSDAWDID